MDGLVAEKFKALQDEGKALASECEEFTFQMMLTETEDRQNCGRSTASSGCSDEGKTPFISISLSSDENPDSAHHQSVDGDRTKTFFSKLVNHMRLVLERITGFMRPYEGLLYASGEDSPNGSMMNRDSPLTTALYVLVNTLDALRVIEKTIWGVLPGALRLSSGYRHRSVVDGAKKDEKMEHTLWTTERGATGSRIATDGVHCNASRDMQNTALKPAVLAPSLSSEYVSLNPEEALRIALLLHSVALLRRDLYLFLSVSTDAVTPPTSLNKPLKSSPVVPMSEGTPASLPADSQILPSRQRQLLAQGLILLKQGHQSVKIEVLGSVLPALLLPYSLPKELWRTEAGNAAQNVEVNMWREDEKNNCLLLHLDTSWKSFYRYVVQLTKEIYKMESRIAHFAYELLQKSSSGDLLGVELPTLVRLIVQEFDVLRGAKNDIQLGVLQAYAGNYNASAARSQKAVKVLSCFSVNKEYQKSTESGAVGPPAISLRPFAAVFQPVALFNLACIQHLMASFFPFVSRQSLTSEEVETKEKEKKSASIGTLFQEAYERARLLPHSPSLVSSPLFAALRERMGKAVPSTALRSRVEDGRRKEDRRESVEKSPAVFAVTHPSSSPSDSVENLTTLTTTAKAVSPFAEPPPYGRDFSHLPFTEAEGKGNLVSSLGSCPLRVEERDKERVKNVGNLISPGKPQKPPHHLPRSAANSERETLPPTHSLLATLPPVGAAPSLSEHYSCGTGSNIIPPYSLEEQTVASASRGKRHSFPFTAPVPPISNDSMEKLFASTTSPQASLNVSPVSSHPSPPPKSLFSTSLASYTYQQNVKKRIENTIEKGPGTVGEESTKNGPFRQSTAISGSLSSSDAPVGNNTTLPSHEVGSPFSPYGDSNVSSSKTVHLSRTRIPSLLSPALQNIPSFSAFTSKNLSSHSTESGMLGTPQGMKNSVKRGKDGDLLEKGNESVGESSSSAAHLSFTSLYQRLGKSNSVVSTVLSCHRLERPDDAFFLFSPSPEVIPPKPPKEAQIEKELEEKEAQRKRERRIRTFLPEEVERKRKKKEERLQRKKKRERHAAKKAYFGKTKAQAVEEKDRDSKSSLRSSSPIRRQDSTDENVLGGEALHKFSITSDVASSPQQFLKTARLRKSTAIKSDNEDIVGGIDAADGAPAPTTAASSDAASRPGEERDAAVTSPEGRRAYMRRHTEENVYGETMGEEGAKSTPTNRRVREYHDSERKGDEGDAADGVSSRKSENDLQEEGKEKRAASLTSRLARLKKHRSTSSFLQDQQLSKRESIVDDVDEFLDTRESFSSLSSSSIAPSSVRSGDDDSELENDDDETVEERKDRYDIEMQLYFFGAHRKREMAAHVIQRAWRCSVARLSLYNLRQCFYQQLYVRQKAASLCIVGYVRSILMQRRLQARRAERLTNDARRIRREQKEVSAVRTIEKAFLRYWAQKRRRAKLAEELNLIRDAQLAQFESACVIVQRWWRIIPPIRDYWVQRGVEVRKQREIEEEHARRTAAATRIQAVVRGRQARRFCRRYRLQRVQEREKQLEKLIWSTELVKLSLTEWCLRAKRLKQAARFEEQREHEAVRCITHGWQAALSNRRFQLALTKSRQIRVAAATIQRAFKKFYASRERRYLREMSITAEKERLDREFLIYRATLKLQCFARVILAKAAYRRQRARYGRGVAYSLTLIQSVGRGLLARQQFNAFRFATHEKQRQEAMRAAQTRQRNIDVFQGFILARESAVKKEHKACDRLTNKLFIRLLVRRELKREKAAVCIQRVFRRYLLLKRAFIKQYEEECAADAALRAVVKIQCAWRQWLSRGEVRKKRWFAFKAEQKRDIQEEVLANQWIIEVQYFMAEFEHQRRHYVNLEADIRDHISWSQQKELKQLYRAEENVFSVDGTKSCHNDEERELPPMNVTVALEGYWCEKTKGNIDAWYSLYAED